MRIKGINTFNVLRNKTGMQLGAQKVSTDIIIIIILINLSSQVPEAINN